MCAKVVGGGLQEGGWLSYVFLYFMRGVGLNKTVSIKYIAGEGRGLQLRRGRLARANTLEFNTIYCYNTLD